MYIIFHHFYVKCYVLQGNCKIFQKNSLQTRSTLEEKLKQTEAELKQQIADIVEQHSSEKVSMEMAAVDFEDHKKQGESVIVGYLSLQICLELIWRNFMHIFQLFINL